MSPPPPQPNIIQSTSSSLSVSWSFAQGAEATINGTIPSFDTPSAEDFLVIWPLSSTASSAVDIDQLEHRLTFAIFASTSIPSSNTVVPLSGISLRVDLLPGLLRLIGLPFLLWSVLDVVLKIFLLNVCIDVLDESFSKLLLNIMRKLAVSKLIQRRRVQS